ncbi:MAG: hypothetical protein Q7U57_13760 [Methylovulum sp.]|nr:hypothetical protein [Methylovulum sp.]
MYVLRAPSLGCLTAQGFTRRLGSYKNYHLIWGILRHNRGKHTQKQQVVNDFLGMTIYTMSFVLRADDDGKIDPAANGNHFCVGEADVAL